MSDGYDAADFDRAVAAVSAEASPRALAERLGVDWEYLRWVALDASAQVFAALEERRGEVVSYGGEAFTAGFLIGAHMGPPGSGLCVSETQSLSRAVDAVQERGRHAIIADHCDLASVARLETVYAESLVESMAVGDPEELRGVVTSIFEAGLAVGLELRSGGDDELPEQP